MKELEILWEPPKCNTETLSEQMSLGQWCHGPIRLAQCKVARNLQFVKNNNNNADLERPIKWSSIKWGMLVYALWSVVITFLT